MLERGLGAVGALLGVLFLVILSYLGISKLPSPTEQVRRHVASQLHSGSNSTNLPPSHSVQQASAYIAAVGAALAPLRTPPTSQPSFADARATLNKVISQLQALTPPAGARDGHRALIAALQRQRDLSFAFERTARAHNSVATTKLEREIIQAQTAMNAAIGRIHAYATGCSSDIRRCGPQLVS